VNTSAKSAKKLFLVDAMAHVYRAFYAPMMRMNAPNGMPTKVPFLFSNILKRLLKDYQPEYLAIVFDPPGATFRDRIFEKYKAQRQPMPDEMRQQLPYVRKLCEAMRMPVVEVEGYEADDVIGTLAVKGGKGGLEVLIVSNDKDMMQLVGDRVKTLRTGSGGAKGDMIVDAERVQEILGVPPERVVDLMSLMGDTVDNIPGAKGIGEKGAAELIQKYGLVENALDHADEVANKRYREALQQQREQVLMSKQLARISTDVPIELTLEALKIQPPNGLALADLYRKLGFTSLLKELGDAALVYPAKEDAGPAAKKDYAEFANVEEFREWLTKLPPEKPLAVWLQLDGTARESEGFGTRVTGIEVSSQSGEGRLAWVDEKEQALTALAPVLKDVKRAKVVHDPKVFQLMLGKVENIQHATQFYSYLLRPTTSKHDLADVMFRQFNVPIGGGAGERADSLHRLAAALRPALEEKKLDKVYEQIELPLAEVLAEMERAGVRVDPEALGTLSESMEKEVRRLEKEIWDLAGNEFNVNSPIQLAEILFDKLNLEVAAKRGRAKARSTAVEILEELSAKHPLPRKIIEYREVAKLKSTYVDSLPKLIHGESGRVHTSISQTVAATGRLSSSDPNLQNIPIRTELGRQIRAAFVAEKGRILLSADYSQI
jgi:DNA polymerase-1